MANLSGRPWNADRFVGPREHFLPSEALQTLLALEKRQNWHDAALISVGIDSLLRCGDLLSLRVSDVSDNQGQVREKIRWGQEKTKRAVTPILTQRSIQALQRWIEFSGKSGDDYLFTRSKGKHDKPISDDTFRKLIKRSAELIGLNPSNYSSHSLRRTKPHFMYRQGVDIAYISTLLGHKDTATTLVYLGIKEEESHHYALKYDIWKKSLHSKANMLVFERKNNLVNATEFDVFQSGLNEIVKRLDQLDASNENLIIQIKALKAEQRDFLSWVKDLLTNPSNHKHGED